MDDATPLGEPIADYRRRRGLSKSSSPGSLAGLEMVEQIPDQGLPRAPMGVNSGPAVVQDGDYFGRTINVAARITEYAAQARCWSATRW